MKTHLRPLVLAFVAMLSTTQAADTPAAILSDYRAKADPAIEKINDTLEKAVVPILAELVKSGDTAGADQVKTQLKAKQDGEPIAQPHAKVAALFTLYDAARVKAVTPARTSAITRLDALLKSSDGKKLEIVTEAAGVREEIETGVRPPVAPNIPVAWTYHGSPTSTSNIAEVHFLPDGNWEMVEAGRKIPGTWKSNKKGDKITIKLADAEWKVSIDGTLATVDRPDVGIRYLRVKGSPVGK